MGLTHQPTPKPPGTRHLTLRPPHVPLNLAAPGLETRTADVTRGLVAPTCKNQNNLDATGADQPHTGPS